ncbi:putative bifunctional diguanylate cyclase/phosphodiesterase [Aestuariibacter salexigens]|uniref:putative bifunctional diguanylate cyclase/phosphodiesterase n=1 Tax=Aestuariibacter salexigens TaxID=226010 RepID=UPI00041E59E3|nr:EAL domain-containing protein [Aestuariibacter salexigens]
MIITNRSRTTYPVAEKVALLYTNSFNGLLVTILVASVLAFGFIGGEYNNAKLMWWMALMALSMVRLADYFYFKLNGDSQHFNASAALIRFAFGILLTAICWGGYGVFAYFFLQNNNIELTVTLVILAAMVGGAANSLAASKTLTICYAVALLLPFSVCSIFGQYDHLRLLGYIGILFGIAIAINAFRASSFIADAFIFKHNNEKLNAAVASLKRDAEQQQQELEKTKELVQQTQIDLEQEIEKRTEKIFQLSGVDPLTGLLNRTAFTSQVENLVESAAELEHAVALLFIDLNGFKQINDAFGHKLGDSVLEEVASRLSAFCQEQHLGRWGGDEFLIVLPYTDRTSALSVAQAIETSIHQPITLASNQLKLSATIGISLFPEHSDNAMELIQMADVTMYEQKRQGRIEPAVFNTDLYARLKDQQALKDGLVNAIENKQLHLVYQPIVNAQKEGVWAVEALLRWDFNGTPVGPDVFIPLAEQSGLIREIGAWVLNRACIDASRWEFSGAPPVSVNVSVIQLFDDNFLDILDRALASSGLPAERLHIEITESVLADNKEKAIAQIQLIKQRGVQVSIDDFGTGFSSLSQLQTLDVDHIKIDRSFVQDLSAGSETIIRATIFIARELGCDCVAEGIETIEMADQLRRMGVTSLQGYYYSKPISNSALLTWANEFEQQKSTHPEAS